MKPVKYREIEHTADVGIIAYGERLETLYTNAALGMLNILHGKLSLSPTQTKFISLKEKSTCDLLVSWLSEINFLILAGDFLTTDIPKLTILPQEDHWKLNAHINGVDSTKYYDKFETEIKAVTYHQLKIEKRKNRFECQVIFDV